MENKYHMNSKAVHIPANTDLNKLHLNQSSQNEIHEDDKTPMEKTIENDPILKLLLAATTRIDFEDFAGDVNIQEFRKDLSQQPASNSRKKMEKTIKEFEPNDDEKCVIINDHLLILAKRLGSGLRFNNGFYYIFNFNYWIKCERPIFEAFLGMIAEKTGVPKLTAKQYKMREKLIKQFETTANFKESPKGDVVKINLRNGTFHVYSSEIGEVGEVGEVGELKSVERDDFLKYQLGFDYDDDAKSPIFDVYLNRVLPDLELQSVLMEYVGYLFTRRMKLEKALILFGSGANGKSVFFEVLMALLGKDNVSNFSMDNLLNDSGNYRINLGNVLVNYCTEVGNIRDMQIYKVLISGEPVSARRLYQDAIIIDDYCKFIFNTNILPKVEQTDGFHRRHILIPFMQTIPENEQDINLHKKIIATELSGVFNHVLRGLERLLSQGRFSASKIVTETINDYKRESNSVQLFLDDDNWKPSLTKKVRRDEIYGQYTRYCDTNNYPPVNSVNFGKRLRALNYEITRGAQGYYYICCETTEDVTVLKTQDAATILSMFFKDSQSPNAL